MKMEMKKELDYLYSYQTKQNLNWTVIKDNEIQCIMIKGSIQQGDINIYACNIRAAKHRKSILIDLKKEIKRISIHKYINLVAKRNEYYFMDLIGNNVSSISI